ncbi:MAG TPA: hypothetical protein V6C88_00755 [Chroococcidiopsis sp.]
MPIKSSPKSSKFIPSVLLLSGLPISLLVLAPQPAQAASLTVKNASFEEFATGCTPTGNFVFGCIKDWDASQFQGAGLFYPASDSSPFTAIPDGTNVAFVNSGYIFQDLSATLESNAKYTVQVSVGSRSDFSAGGYRLELLAGGTSLGAQDFLFPSESNGSFITSKLDYTSPLTDALIGSTLQIRLYNLSSNTQTSFDSISLISESLNPPSPTPTPTDSPDPSPSPSPSDSPDPSPSPSPSDSPDPSPSPSPTDSPDPSPSPSPSDSPDPSPSPSPSDSPDPSPSPSPSDSPDPSPSPTKSPSPAPTPSPGDHVSVPEPGTTSGLVLLGLLGARAAFKKRSRSSQSQDK